jgi:hypothetical protein
LKSINRPSLVDALFVNGSALAFAALVGAVVWALQFGRY